MHYKQNNKETKSYVQGLRPFGNTLPRGIRGILRKNGYNYSEIITKWKVLIEKDISDFSYPKIHVLIKFIVGFSILYLLYYINSYFEIEISFIIGILIGLWILLFCPILFKKSIR